MMIFSTTQHCNIVVTLFLIVTTLQRCVVRAKNRHWELSHVTYHLIKAVTFSVMLCFLNTWPLKKGFIYLDKNVFERTTWLCLSGIVFEGTREVYERIYHFSSKLLRKKEKYANSKWILTNLFCCSSNLSKDYFISYRAGLKRVWITIFFGLKEVRIWRTGWHTPTKNSQHNLPGLFLHKKSSYVWHTVVMQSLCRMLG